jgi:predicted amidohydrolase YtcJ
MAAAERLLHRTRSGEALRGTRNGRHDHHVVLLGKGELVRERLGDHLLPDFIPFARLLDSGLHVGCGTDWGPKNVFEHIALAVEPYYAASGRSAATPGIGRQQALDMWTREAAHVLRWESIGSLEPGHHADLVIVDRDPLRCPIEDLPGTQVIATVLAGQTVAGADLTEGERRR